MTNRTRLQKVISFLSQKTNELYSSVAFPAFDRLTKDNADSIRILHHIFDVAMKIIWLCQDILSHEDTKAIEDREQLKIDLLMTRIYEPYLITFEAFYSYLCKWRSDYMPSSLKRAIEAVKTEKTHHYYCEALQYRFDLDY